MVIDNNKDDADALIAKIMKQFGFRHQYQVAEYFGVTAQTLSGWVKTNIVPDKYIMKYQLDIQDMHQYDNLSDENLANFSKQHYSVKQFSFTIFFANNIRPLIVIPIILSILSLALVLFIIRPVYTSTAKVLPIGDSGSSFSEMAGMASQLGLSMPVNFGNQIPWDEMFPEIIKSENLVQSILNEKFSSNKYGNKQYLSSIIEQEYNLKNKLTPMLKLDA